jgi:S-DNA-T family DNA segregation ATPase FtsK/SpoIIIE
VHAGNLAEYRRLADRPQEPRVIVLLDGLSAFREAYEADVGRTQVWSAFQRIVAEGRPLGIHVVMAGERPGALPTSLSGSVTRRLVLRQADENAYGVLDVPKDVLGPQSPPGRGVFSGDADELQVAVPGGRTSPAEQAAELGRLATRLRAEGIAPAPPVRRLPSQVELESLPASVDGLPVLGIADDTLQPVGFSPHGTIVLAGLPGSGRSTVLDTLASALRRWGPDLRMYYVGNRRSPLHASPTWTEAAVDAQGAAALAKALLPDLTRPADPDRPVVLVVESLTDFLGGPAEQALAQAFKAARQNDHLVLAESETSAWGSSWPLVAEIRNGRRGLVLQPDHLDGEALFRTPFPRMARAEFPAGRGVWVESGTLRRVQVAFRA